MEQAIRRTAGSAALRRIQRFIAEEEATERSLRHLVLPAVAISSLVLVLVVLTLLWR
jgi:hypothetical protein